MTFPFRMLVGLIAISTAGLAPGSVVAAPAAAPQCPASGLVVWLNTQGNAAAGSSYYTLEFTNLSGHSCILKGYPGASALGLNGAALGSAATREPSTAAAVTLANGSAATAVLRIVVAQNYPASKCHSVTAAALRVYPPGQTAAKVVPFPFTACSKAGPAFLTVKAVT
jgi:Protein of unknown function (DUF4232)